MPWSIAQLADSIAEGLQSQAQADDLEQAVYGFDHRDELGLHPLIQQALAHGGYGVWPEQQYPSDWHRARRSEGRRCDVVLTPAPDRPLRDPMVKGTLFDTPQAIDAQDAYWMEIKTVAQFESGGPFPRYSAELFSPVVKDIKKLWLDPIISFAGLLLVLFTVDQTTAEHDIAAWHQHCLAKGYPIATPAVRGLSITDRIGNGYCAAAMFGIRGV